MPSELKFEITSNTHYLPLLREIVRRFLPPPLRLHCTIALVEGVDNAIFHAHKGKKEKWITIRIKNERPRVEMEVWDSGGGFDLNGIQLPSMYSTTGRGLFLINSLMNEVAYVKDKGRNVLKMVYVERKKTTSGSL